MATEVEVQVVVQDEADSASADYSLHQEDNGSQSGLFRRKKNKQKNEKKSKKPPGT